MIGDLVAMLTVMKGLPLAYNSDLQEDKERVFDALDTIKPALDLIAKLWPQLSFKPAVMAAAAGGFALATDLAEYLVARGLPFREAHEAIGALVRDAAAAGRTMEQLTLVDLHRYSPVFDADAISMLSAANSLRARKIIGGPAPATVRRRLAKLER